MPQVLHEEIRSRYKTCAVEHKNPMLFAAMVLEQVGLCDRDGRLYQDKDQKPRLAEKPRCLPTDFHPRVLAEAMIGQDWREVLGLQNSSSIFATAGHFRDAARGGRVREESAAPVGPSVFANIAAWSATVGGLMGAQFIKSYDAAAFDVADLFPIRPAVFWQGGERYIDVIGPYQPAPQVGPAEEYPDMSLSALWVEPGPMKKYGGKVTLAKEVAEIQISSGEIVAAAGRGGESLKFRENELSLDVITGQTQNFKLGMLTDASATGYNTYGPSITNPAGTSRTVGNDHVNPLNDLGAFQKSDELLANLYHPVTDFPIEAKLDTVLLPTPMEKVAQWLLGMTDLDALNQTTNPQAQDAAGTFPNTAQKGKNPYQGVWKPVVSRWLHARHVASTTQPDANRTAGLGLTGAAQYRYYRMDPAKFACRRQKWAATSITASPNDWVMATQGLVFGQVFDIATMVQVLSPYHIQRNKGA